MIVAKASKDPKHNKSRMGSIKGVQPKKHNKQMFILNFLHFEFFIKNIFLVKTTLLRYIKSYSSKSKRLNRTFDKKRKIFSVLDR